MLPETPNIKTKANSESSATITTTTTTAAPATPSPSPPVSPMKRAVVPNVPQKQCAPCHTSCLRCRGPLDRDCTECTPEMAYREVSPNEAYCDAGEHGWPQVVKLFDNDHNSNETMHNFSYKSMVQLFFNHISIYLVCIYIVIVTIIVFTIRAVWKTFFASTVQNGNDKKNYAYNRIAYDSANEHIITEQEKFIHASDSSEETEMIK